MRGLCSSSLSPWQRVEAGAQTAQPVLLPRYSFLWTVHLPALVGKSSPRWLTALSAQQAPSEPGSKQRGFGRSSCCTLCQRQFHLFTPRVCWLSGTGDCLVAAAGCRGLSGCWRWWWFSRAWFTLMYCGGTSRGRRNSLPATTRGAALTQAVVLRSFWVIVLGVATASPPCSWHDIGPHCSIFGE